MGHLRVSSSSCFKARTSAIDMKMSFNSHVNKSCFYKKDFALSLVLKVRVIEKKEMTCSSENENH